MGRFAGGVDHDVEAAAMAHGHDGFGGAMLGDGVENGVEQGNERGHAFERKALGAEIAGLQDLLEEVGANEALENFFLVDFGLRTFDALDDPAAAVWLGKVHGFRADVPPVAAAGFTRGVPREGVAVAGRGVAHGSAWDEMLLSGGPAELTRCT